MKRKDLQKVRPSKYQNGHTTTKIHRHLNGGIGLRTIKRWCQMIRHSGSIKLSSPSGNPRFARMKGNIQKIKHSFTPKEKSISSKTMDRPSIFPREMFDE